MNHKTNQEKLPAVLVEIERRIEELEIVKQQWKEVQKAQYDIPRDILGGMSFRDRIDADKRVIELMQLRSFEMAKHPAQMEMDFDDIG